MNRKLYKPLLYFIFLEFFLLSFLSEMEVQIQSWIGSVVGTFVFFVPIELLLYLLSVDELFSSKKQTRATFYDYTVVKGCSLILKNSIEQPIVGFLR